MKRVYWLVFVGTFLASSPGFTQVPQDSGFHKLDAKVSFELSVPAPRLARDPSTGEMVLLARQNYKAPVIIALYDEVDAHALEILAEAGIEVQKAGGKKLAHGRFVHALIDLEVAEVVDTLSIVERVYPAPQQGPLPMDNSAELISLGSAWGSSPASDLLNGQGILVADIDSNADIFHPKFFKGDAGYFDWIDMDGDGALTPGVDAVDLDGDGTGVGEIAVALISQTVMTHYGDALDARGDDFDPSVDWIYIDENGNGERDYGSWNGFDESIPAYGEPIFVPDDLNGNGSVDVGERLVRLGTSKFVKVLHFFEYPGYPTIDRVYERGVDMSEFDTNFMGDSDIFSAAGHGSGVCGIVAGDLPLVGRRWVGVAPEAELILAVDQGYEGTGLTWVLSEGADVVLHERANWFGEPLDGGDITSMMVDESTANDGVIHTCPVGNTGGSRKHTHLEMPAGGARSFDFEIPELEDMYYVSISLNFRGNGEESLTLVPPLGSSLNVTHFTQNGDLDTGGKYYTTYRQTQKGTRFYEIVLYVESAGQSIPTGDWELQVQEGGTGTISFDGYLMDNVSSWGVGVAWDESIAGDDRTIGWPATSETCIAVGAHTGHPSSPDEPWYYHPEAAGEIREYSGRGPTIDGRQKPDVAAPDNPWSATPHGQAKNAMVPHGAVAPFGGTSGAGPHVTGVTAMLAQMGIWGEDALQAVRGGAVADETTGDVPNYSYGWGRLSAAGALQVDSESTVPTVTLNVLSAVVGEPVVVVVDAQGGEGLQIKWDEGYDGTWDTEYQAIANLEKTFDELGEYIFKARVRNSSGRVAEAVALVSVTDGSGGGSDGCGCTVGDSKLETDLLKLLLGIF